MRYHILIIIIHIHGVFEDKFDVKYMELIMEEDNT